MGKHCLQLVLTLLLLFSPYARRFSKQTDEKIHAEQCLVLSSRWQTQQTHVCFQLGLSAVHTSEPTSKTRGNALLVLLLRNVMYRNMYRDNCIGIHIVSWKNVLLQAY